MTPAPPITPQEQNSPKEYACSLCLEDGLDAIALVRHIRCFHDMGITEAVSLANEIKDAGPS